MYVALALRSALPLVLPPRAGVRAADRHLRRRRRAVLARGVRAIVRSEKQLDYAAAAASLGAGHARLLLRHLLPAARGFIGVEITLLVPAFIVAEATLSYVGPRLSGSGRELGHDAARRVERPRVRGLSVAAQSRRRRCSWWCSA